jgi:hypothetical protein
LAKATAGSNAGGFFADRVLLTGNEMVRESEAADLAAPHQRRQALHEMEP